MGTRARVRWLVGAGLVLVAGLGSLALVVAGRADRMRKTGGPMTREETGRLVEALGRSLGDAAAYPQSGGILLPNGQIWFEYTDQNAFVCSVLVSDFAFEGADLPEAERERIDRALLEGFGEEERWGTPTGGAKLEYVPETKRLFLSRTYLQPVDEKTFIADMHRLVEAGNRWGREVFDRVMDRIQAQTERR